MAAQKKTFELPSIGEIVVQKKSRSSRLSLRISPTGVPTVSIPPYIPFEAGRRFALSQLEWIEKHSKPRLEFEIPGVYSLYDSTEVRIQLTDNRNSTTQKAGVIVIKVSSASETAEKYIVSTIKKFLAHDTKNVVEPLVSDYSSQMNDFPSAVKFKSTTSKWGSCNSKRELVFSSYMAQLPNDLIRYVVIHELAHLSNMNHSPQFWAKVAQFDPNFKTHRKALKSHELRPIVKKVSTMR